MHPDLDHGCELVDPTTGEVMNLRDIPGKFPLRRTSVSLSLPETISFEEWREVGSQLQSISRSVMWWIGDWLHFGERKWSEMYADAVEETGRQEQTLMNAKWVAGRIPISRRREKLSWGHHAAVAGIEDESGQDELLDHAESEGLNVHELRREVRRRKGLPDPAPRSVKAPEPEPEPIPGETRGQVAMLRDWLVTGSRLRATFKSGQVAALRSRECGVHHDPDRIDVLIEFLEVLHHTLTADREADEQAEGSTADLRREHAKERANGSVGTRP